MSVTISRLYNSYSDAQQAVRNLEACGVPHGEISIVANNAESWYDQPKAVKRTVDRDLDGTDDRAEGAATGAGIGAAVGGTAGLLAGLGMLAIPGVGPVVAAGWLAALATGAVAGGATGGLVGALTQSGVGEDEAHVYAEGIRRGGALVTARVPDGRRAECEAVLDRAAVNVGDRASLYRKSGWDRFDPAATPYTADQIRKERDLYR
jgi:hypothetical protein